MLVGHIFRDAEPTLLTSTKPDFDFDHASYNIFFRDFYETNSEEVCNPEHVLFLTF